MKLVEVAQQILAGLLAESHKLWRAGANNGERLLTALRRIRRQSDCQSVREISPGKIGHRPRADWIHPLVRTPPTQGAYLNCSRIGKLQDVKLAAKAESNGRAPS